MTLKEALEIIQPITIILSSIAVPLVIAHFGNSVAVANKESENRLKYVELAVSVLQADPKPDAHALRTWAVDLLDSQAPTKLSSEARKQLQQKPLDLRPAMLGGNVTLDPASVSGAISGDPGK
jgi:ribosome biogenesis SPOUT family RNA methylase Rps3